MPLLSEVLLNVRVKLQIRQTPNDTIYDDDIRKAINNALTRFSRDFPAQDSQEYIGNSENTYPLPTNWDEVSQIDGIYFRPYKFPYDRDRYLVDERVDVTERDLDQVEPGVTSVTLTDITEAAFFGDGDVVAILDAGEQAEQNWVTANGDSSTGIVALKNATAGLYADSPTIKKLPQLFFLSINPASTDVFKVNYTKTHVLSEEVETDNTILAKHQDAFEHLAAAFTAYAISAKYANTQVPSIDVDAVDYGSKSQQWREVAEAEMKLYEEHVGLNQEKRTEAASTLLNLNLSRNLPGMNVLYPTDRTGFYFP